MAVIVKGSLQGIQYRSLHPQCNCSSYSSLVCLIFGMEIQRMDSIRFTSGIYTRNSHDEYSYNYCNTGPWGSGRIPILTSSGTINLRLTNTVKYIVSILDYTLSILNLIKLADKSLFNPRRHCKEFRALYISSILLPIVWIEIVKGTDIGLDICYLETRMG